MFEELYISGKELNTEHPDILVVPKGDNISDGFVVSEFETQLNQIISKAKSFDSDAIQGLNQIVASKYNLNQARSNVIPLNKMN